MTSVSAQRCAISGKPAATAVQLCGVLTDDGGSRAAEIVADCEAFYSALVAAIQAGALRAGVVLHSRDSDDAAAGARFQADERSLDALRSHSIFGGDIGALMDCARGGPELRRARLAALNGQPLPAASAEARLTLRARIECFVRDLRCFKSDKGARRRLECGPQLRDCVQPSSFLSPVYFTPREQRWLLAFPASTDSAAVDDAVSDAKQAERAPLPLRAALGLTMAAKRTARKSVCTAHDLAPFFMQAFALAKNFDHEAAFNKAYKAFFHKWSDKDPCRQMRLAAEFACEEPPLPPQQQTHQQTPARDGAELKQRAVPIADSKAVPVAAAAQDSLVQAAASASRLVEGSSRTGERWPLPLAYYCPN